MIRFPGGTIVNDIFAVGATPSSDFGEALSADLVTAGWARTQISATSVLTFAGQPANNDTVTLGSVTYTFKTSINNSNANEVLIGALTADSIANLAAAITHGAGSGTNYSTPTVANPDATVSTSDATTLTAASLTPGITGNTGIAVSESGSNTSWSVASLRGGYDQLISAKTPAGLQLLLRLSLTGGTSIFDGGVALSVVIGDPTGTRLSNSINNTNQPIGNGSSPTYHIVAHRYGFVSFAEGLQSGQTAGAFMVAGVPYIEDFMKPLVITSATAAAPIVCVLATALSATTGDSVLVTGAAGMTGLNGLHVVTVVDSTHISLDGSTGVGTYTASSAVIANITTQGQIAEAIFGAGTATGGGANWRDSIQNAANGWASLNASVNVAAGSNDSNVTFDLPEVPASDELKWYNNQYVMSEPMLWWGKVQSASPYLIGQLYNGVIARKSISLDQAATFDSHNWITVGVSSTTGYSFLFATN